MAWHSVRKSAELLWLSENREADIRNRGCSMKEFNVTGTCIPEENYMVDMTEKLDQMIRMIEKGQYFTINRARQYGKTTALALLYRRLREKYTIIRLSFEGTGEISFSSDRAFVEMFIRAAAEFGKITGIPEELLGSWKDLSGLLDNPKEDAIDYLSRKITALCKASSREILLMIDEVDKSSNNQVFLNFLGMLRNKYLRRREGLDVTFKSVILAGVYDIKNLKLKIRPDAEKRYNSPWNIAADFNVDMSFSADEIGGMLKEYEADHNTGMDIGRISHELYFYTGGYPFLVSRLCKWLDEEGGRVWTTDNIKNAETALLKTRNTLFDDLIKNVENNEELKNLLIGILYDGNKYSFNISNPVINLGVMFGILAEQDHMTVISNIIFETYLYDYFVSIKSMEKSFPVSGRDQFIREGKETEEYEKINRITREIVDEVIWLLQDNVYKIVLYGSYARGDFTDESDIDILILLNCSKEQVMQYRKQISRLSSRIGLKNDIEISLLLRDRETFERAENILPFYKNVKKEGIEIYG